MSPLTSDPARSLSPLWTADGQRVVFTSFRAGYPELFWRPHDGSGSDERLLTRAKDLLNVRADDWSRDGKYLLFTESWPSGQAAIGQMAIARPSDVKVLVKSKLRNAVANVSPDGLWIAYESSESGQLEIYVERYPQLGSKKKISTGSGRLPIWSRDGRELFFSSLDGRQMFAVAVQPGVAPVIGRPEVLFEFTMLRVQGSFRPVRRRPRWKIPDHPQRAGGSGRRHIVELDPGTELVRGVEASRADQLTFPACHPDVFLEVTSLFSRQGYFYRRRSRSENTAPSPVMYPLSPRHLL